MRKKEKTGQILNKFFPPPPKKKKGVQADRASELFVFVSWESKFCRNSFTLSLCNAGHKSNFLFFL